MGEPADPKDYMGEILEFDKEGDSVESTSPTKAVRSASGSAVEDEVQQLTKKIIANDFRKNQPWTKAVGSRVDTNVDSPHHHQGMGRSGGAAGTKNWRG